MDQNLQKNKQILKITYTLTTMLRNIVASKAAVGPVNTFNGKTVTVLTPQEELIAANAKIKQL